MAFTGSPLGLFEALDSSLGAWPAVGRSARGNVAGGRAAPRIIFMT